MKRELAHSVCGADHGAGTDVGVDSQGADSGRSRVIWQRVVIF